MWIRYKEGSSASLGFHKAGHIDHHYIFRFEEVHNFLLFVFEGEDKGRLNLETLDRVWDL
jgi:hypothetical protein